MQYRHQLQRARMAGLGHTAHALRTRLARRLRGNNLPMQANRDGALCASLGIESLSACSLREKLITSNPGVYFLDEGAAAATLCKLTFPSSVQATISRADAICRHAFTFLGKEAHFGEIIDWFWCPETNGSWPLIEAQAEKSIENLPGKPGDIRYPWELNRHQYFVTLAQSYLYCGDERYVREITRQLSQWRACNPCPRGQNWVSMVEVGIRLTSWVNTWWLLRKTPAFTDELCVLLAQSIYDAATWLSRNLTTYWLIPTHNLIGESAALFLVATLFPVFEESEQWRELALDNLASQVEMQIYPDGVSKEQSTGYHRFVLDFVLLAVDTAEANNLEIPATLNARLRAMLDYQHHLLQPDGTAPGLGDCDGGRGFTLDESLPFWNFQSWQAVAAVRENRGSHVQTAGNGSAEALWFLGPNRWARFVALRETACTDRESIHFEQGGYAVLRTGSFENETSVGLRCGPFGLGGASASLYSHADMLAPVIAWNGKPFAVEIGAAGTGDSAESHDRIRCTSAHNTFAPRGVEQADRDPIYGWEKTPDAKVQWFDSNDERSVLSAVFKSPQGFTHRRTIAVAANPVSIRIEDRMTVTGDSVERMHDWFMHFAPGIELRPVGESTFEIVRDGVVIARLMQEGFGESDIQSVPYSPTPGSTVEIARLRFSVEGACLQTRVIILPAD